MNDHRELFLLLGASISSDIKHKSPPLYKQLHRLSLFAAAFTIQMCSSHFVEYYGTRTLSPSPLWRLGGKWALLLPASSPFTLLAQQSKDPTIESTKGRR